MWFLLFLIVSRSFACTPFLDSSLYQNGDILLQDLRGSFGESVENTTGSAYSHVGLVRVDAQQKIWIVEATTPFVKETPLAAYLRRTRSKAALVRIKDLKQQHAKASVNRAMTHVGKPYDRHFVLNETSALYCSELIYDAYSHGAGLYVFPVQPMDFSDNLEYWQKWFGDHPIPQGELGLSPQNTYDFPRSEVILEAQCKHPRQALFHTLYTN